MVPNFVRWKLKTKDAGEAAKDTISTSTVQVFIERFYVFVVNFQKVVDCYDSIYL